MATSFPRLFEPGRIGNVELKNRIIKAPQHTGLANPDGSITDRLLRYYKDVAQGGVSMVIVEYAWVDNDASQASPCQLGIARMEHVPGLSLLADTIKANGAKAAIQISHAGRQRFVLEQPKAASDVPWPEITAAGCPIPTPMTIEEIREVVKAFGRAAKRAQTAGFDMVEIHACHGYLVSNFFSPYTNKRTDWYGGPLENRMRLLLDIVKEIKAQVGPDYPICARLSGTDYEPGGHTIEDTVELSKRLEARGVAAIHMSGGNHHTTIHEVSPMGMPLAHNVWAAEAVKKVTTLPVIASGSINLPDLAESILTEGKGDFIGLGRPLWADPQWPLKAREGRPEDIRPCIRCNDGCLARGDHIANTVRCTVNVALCREEEFTITPASHPMRVAVVGGGPAGMEAARVCALKGHDVTLYEKRELGGALIEASIPGFKAPDLKPLVAYLKTQVEKTGVKVVRREATLTDLTGGTGGAVGSAGDGRGNGEVPFDAVIVATGATALGLEDIPGIADPKVVSAAQVLHGAAELGDRVVVIGGGIVGTEVGLVIAESGREVIFVEMLDEFMCNITFDERQVYEERFKDLRVSINTGQRLVGVTGAGIVVTDKMGAQTEIAADSVVLAAGFRPNRELLEELRSHPGVRVAEAGDCVKPRKIYDAIHDGHLAAKLLDTDI
jgi:2,4-dienoyl-CoA reductase-like NADH-dependent reductase (Old Yellow Enzyme family)/thioredoxin reductase